MAAAEFKVKSALSLARVWTEPGPVGRTAGRRRRGVPDAAEIRPHECDPSRPQSPEPTPYDDSLELQRSWYLDSADLSFIFKPHWRFYYGCVSESSSPDLEPRLCPLRPRCCCELRFMAELARPTTQNYFANATTHSPARVDGLRRPIDGNLVQG